jgi:hypothetical protein
MDGTLEVDKKSLAIFARYKRPYVNVQKIRFSLNSGVFGF